MKAKPKSKHSQDSIYIRMAKLNPEAHKLSISLGMTGLVVSIPTSDIILQVFEKMKTMKGKFDLETACKISASVEAKYSKII